MEILLNLDWLAIIISVVVTMAFGFWYYSKAAFGTRWLALQGITDADMEAGKGMTGTMVCAVMTQVIVIGAYNYALVAMNVNPFCVAALVVIGFIAPIIAGGSIWERKPWGLFWINLGHWVGAFILIALVYALF